MNPVKALENHGQAVWLDFLARGFVAKHDVCGASLDRILAA